MKLKLYRNRFALNHEILRTSYMYFAAQHSKQLPNQHKNLVWSLQVECNGMYILNHKISSLYGLPKYFSLGLLDVLCPLLFDSNQNF